MFAMRAHAHWILPFYYYVIGNVIRGYISINPQFSEPKRICGLKFGNRFLGRLNRITINIFDSIGEKQRAGG